MNKSEELTILLNLVKTETKSKGEGSHCPCAKCQKEKKDEGTWDNHYKIVNHYIDFTHPENFMKLLEMVISVETSMTFNPSNLRPSEYLIEWLLIYKPGSLTVKVYNQLAQFQEWKR